MSVISEFLLSLGNVESYVCDDQGAGFVSLLRSPDTEIIDVVTTRTVQRLGGKV